jgi:diaminohydroxyphosphoribosylaminopyrimidine deaminase/5-amino-6-(5-phosphoribosylamino)uracil reductase
MLRAEADAILVGSNTARDDDPELTCRLPGLAARSPIRIVLSRGLDLSPDLKLIRTAREAPTWVFTGTDADADRVRVLEAAGARVLGVPSDRSGLRLQPILARLADEGITRLMVEGGETVWRAFAGAKLADEVVLFQAGGSGREAETATGLAAREAPGLDLALADTRRLGADTMATFRVRPCAHEASAG